MREKIKELIAKIAPFDVLEKEHITNSIQWISETQDIFRIKKPAIPPKHLVAYFVPIDQKAKKVLMINHIKSGLWLPPGGHIEKNEDPIETVKREMQEELYTQAHFITSNPFFITVTKTINIDAGHTDISLWYLVHGNEDTKYEYDRREMKGYRWFSFEELLKPEINQFDPHIIRFTNKLLQYILHT